MLEKEIQLGRIRFTTSASRFLGQARLICLVCLTLTVSTSAQETMDYRALNTLEREATFVLFDKDVGAVANQLATNHATSVVPLLRNLIIYARAGHHGRLRQTLEQLAQASDWKSCAQSYFVRDKIRSAIPVDDLADWRFYYDHLCPREADGAEAFIRLWEQQGDAKELDDWLAAHSAGSDEWFRYQVYRLAKLGRAREVLEPLAADVKANSGDLSRLERYLNANHWAGDLQEVGWLADVYEMHTAYEYYELGQWLQRTAPRAAAQLFMKSLSLPFAERNAQLVRERGFRYASVIPAHVNWEKQLRFWSKRGLAEAYQALQRPQDAQPLIEELVAMKGNDIVAEDIHQLAGKVQARSGQRVVEAAVLRDEVTQRETARYWLERAAYYRGREEHNLENETYRKALEALPHNPKDEKASAERLEVVASFCFSLWESRDQRENWSSEIDGLLRREFTSVPPETRYAFRIAGLITDDQFKLNELRHSLFAEQPTLLARLLAPRADWENDEQTLIERAVRGDEITPTEQSKIWIALEKLVSDPGSSRAYRLAEAMTYCGASQRAIPLLLGYLKNAQPSDYVDRNQILNNLIDAYCQKGDWQAAEKLLFAYKDWSWQSTTRQLGVIAVSAGQHGATSDALRLWRLKANLDRRDLTGLEQLSRTEAKLHLRAFYLQMRKNDPMTLAPDLALRLLR